VSSRTRRKLRITWIVFAVLAVATLCCAFGFIAPDEVAALNPLNW
jgi:hypothetical protein